MRDYGEFVGLVLAWKCLRYLWRFDKHKTDAHSLYNLNPDPTQSRFPHEKEQFTVGFPSRIDKEWEMYLFNQTSVSYKALLLCDLICICAELSVIQQIKLSIKRQADWQFWADRSTPPFQCKVLPYIVRKLWFSWLIFIRTISRLKKTTTHQQGVYKQTKTFFSYPLDTFQYHICTLKHGIRYTWLNGFFMLLSFKNTFHSRCPYLSTPEILEWQPSIGDHEDNWLLLSCF